MTWHELAVSATDLRGEVALPYVVAGVPILLIGDGDGWWAIEDRCTHADCPFSTDGEVDGLIAICNCHGSEFDVRTGAVLAMPATESLRTFPVRHSAARLEVEL